MELSENIKNKRTIKYYKTLERDLHNVHNNKYNYDLSIMTGSKNKFIIVCPYHGVFEQSPKVHKTGVGCPKCSGLNLDTNDIIKEFNTKHKGKYNYNKTKYIGTNEKVIVTCFKHSDFIITPHQHKLGVGCPKCSGRNLTNEERIKLLVESHGDKYDYEKVIYTKAQDNIIIGCNKHGYFNMKYYAHKQGQGCPKCSREKTNYEKYKDRPTILYYVKVNNLWKIGICLVDKRFKTTENNILKGRFRTDIKNNNVDIDIIKYKVYNDGWKAYLKEQEVLEKYDNVRYHYKNNDMDWFGGYTELFTEDIINKIQGD